jgi:hypothetical protein
LASLFITLYSVQDVYRAKLNLEEDQGQASDVRSSQTHDAHFSSSSIVVLLRKHGVNRTQRRACIPGSRPVRSQNNTALWPVFVDVCFIHILSRHNQVVLSCKECAYKRSFSVNEGSGTPNKGRCVVPRIYLSYVTEVILTAPILIGN